MQKTETKLYTPDSVPVVSQAKIYYSADVQAAGGVDAFLKSIGSDKAKQLPKIDFSEAEWEQMLKTDL
ncbi:hypothetical protein [Spirosoma foliorum]|uniref:Uncharacterized protein n=1 Tax=Spirosoma foliorum TaxID=2710596 RepID=A0A7G5GTM2_9BACT|nr:hypothetical protein [Spirosoma foliorum]QMW02214.1 hypothetical protein H3H32_30525 [Spirosoma foliorum]